MLIRDGEKGGWAGEGYRGGGGGGEREIIYLLLLCHHQNDFCTKVCGDESHGSVS